MKGVSIAINVMVILVIALIVLISIIILFSDVWFSGVSSLTLEGVKNSACERLIGQNQKRRKKLILIEIYSLMLARIMFINFLRITFTT